MWQDAKGIITRKMRASAGYTPARILRVSIWHFLLASPFKIFTIHSTTDDFHTNI